MPSKFKTSATRSFGAAGANNLSLSLAALPGVHNLFSRPLELSAAAAGDHKTIAARSSSGRGEYPVILTSTLLLWQGWIIYHLRVFAPALCRQG